MIGFSIPERAHLVRAYGPISDVDGWDTARFHMGDHERVDIVLMVGVSTAGFNIKAQAHTLNAAGVTEDIAFRVYSSGADDLLGAGAEVAAAGTFAVPATDNIMVVVSVRAQQMPAGKKWLSLNASSPGGATLVAVLAVLTGGKYQGPNDGRSVL